MALTNTGARTVTRWPALSDRALRVEAKGFGCLGIVDCAGRLKGIIADGDLSRHLSPEPAILPH